MPPSAGVPAARPAAPALPPPRQRPQPFAVQHGRARRCAGKPAEQESLPLSGKKKNKRKYLVGAGESEGSQPAGCAEPRKGLARPALRLNFGGEKGEEKSLSTLYI